MRARRGFVIEYKSGRRRANPAKSSIWGDADLKRLSQEVEDQVPRFGPGDAAVIAARDFGAAAAAQSDEQVRKPRILPSLPEAGASDEPSRPLKAAVSSVRPVGRSAVTQPSGELQQDVFCSNVAIQAEVEELRRLEQDNHRLKAMWQSRLLRENAQLKAMLAEVFHS